MSLEVYFGKRNGTPFLFFTTDGKAYFEWEIDGIGFATFIWLAVFGSCFLEDDDDDDGGVDGDHDHDTILFISACHSGSLNTQFAASLGQFPLRAEKIDRFWLELFWNLWKYLEQQGRN